MSLMLRQAPCKIWQHNLTWIAFCYPNQTKSKVLRPYWIPKTQQNRNRVWRAIHARWFSLNTTFPKMQIQRESRTVIQFLRVVWKKLRIFLMFTIEDVFNLWCQNKILHMGQKMKVSQMHFQLRSLFKFKRIKIDKSIFLHERNQI